VSNGLAEILLIAALIVPTVAVVVGVLFVALQALGTRRHV